MTTTMADPAAPTVRDDPRGPTRSRWRAVGKGLSLGLSLALALTWLVLLRPPFLGGATSYVIVSGVSMEPGMHTGDLVLARHQRSYAKGDVIAYRIPDGDPAAGSMVIHRIVGGDGVAGYLTRGDNTSGDDLWRPTDDDVRGRAWVLVPRAGQALALLQTPIGLALLAGVVTVTLLAGPPRARR